MFEKWISRKEESELPGFSSIREALDFFRDKYGDDFIIESIEDVGGQECYFCALIVDRQTYDEGQRMLRKGLSVSGIEYLQCSQPIQINENGTVHIVH